jgi:chromosome partitioning protein
MPTICITNQKGGCGKTMTAINLGAGLARQDRRVLLVDLDPQGPVAAELGAPLPEDLLPLAPAILDRLLDRIVIPTPTAGLWVIPSDTSIDAQTFYKKPPTTIRRALHALEQPFDFIVLDTPPNLDLVTLNAIMAADWLMLPCDVDKESLLSLRRTIEVVFEYVEDREDVVLEDFYRVLVTMVDPRSRVMNRWFETQIAPLAPVLFQTRIHRADAFKKARTEGLSIYDYVTTRRIHSKESQRAAEEYTRLTEEVIAHATRRAQHAYHVSRPAPTKRSGKSA